MKHVRRAHALEQPPGDRLQHLVAGEVAEAVVDDLEAVDVEVEQGATPAGFLAQAPEDVVEPFAQKAAVRQAGQRIVHGVLQ